MTPKKLTKTEINLRLYSRGIVMIGGYVNSDTKTLFQCNKGHSWKATPTNIVHGGRGCPECSGSSPLDKNIINARLADLGIEMVGDYINGRTDTLFRNKEGKTWMAKPANVLSSNGKQRRIGKPRLNKTIINERLVLRKIIMLDEYQHQKVKARFQCEKGHIWSARPNNVLSGKGCPKCGKLSAIDKMRLPENEVHKRLKGRDLKMIGEFIGTQTKTLFKCAQGHTWKTTPNSVMEGKGCAKCAGNIPLTKSIVNERIADRSIILVGEYQGAHVTTLFRCKNSHTWLARPNNILQGKNCPHCDGQFPLSNDIVNEKIVDRGLIMLGEYVNSVTPTLFQCSLGHTWKTSPGKVIAGSGCGKCAGNQLLTTEILNDRIAHLGVVIVDEYINSSTNRRFQCREGHIWESTPTTVQNGAGCIVCSDHTTDNDVFYLWLAGPQNLVQLEKGAFLLKYGITSERRDVMRIKEVGWSWNTYPNIIALVKTSDPATNIEKLASSIGRPLSSYYSQLDGWTEFRIVTETEIAMMMAIADEAADYKIAWNNPVPHIKKYSIGQLRLDF